MTTKEIIEMLRICADDDIICPACPRYEQYEYGGTAECHEKLVQEAADALETALREQEERENPKPLTMDELRQMDGEPVWIERCGSDSQDDKGWALVFDAGGFCRTSVGNIAFFALYGIGWLAYRSKPKEE